MSSVQKETIFIDIEDDITAIIDKVISSQYKIVALVLPKRATVLQSVVNMKLLKRAADDAKKQIVLITSEAALLPIAAATGLYVAKTLQSRPAVPAVDKAEPDKPVEVSADDTATDEKPLDPTKSIGELAVSHETDDADIEVGSVDEDDNNKTKPAKSRFAIGKKIHIPNFERFRLGVILAVVLAVLLIGGGVYAQIALPKAKITVTTETSNVDVNLNMIASPKAKEADIKALIIPLSIKEITKTDSEKVAATGERDTGNKASGVVSLKNCAHTLGKVPVPAGTAASNSNLSFIIQENVELPASSFNGVGTCQTASVDANVVAQNAGDKYNISAGRTFTVAGFSQIQSTNAAAMGGGTSHIIKVVSQDDLDKAKQTVLDRSNTAGADQLKTQLTSTNYAPLPDTLVIGAPKITSTPKLGEEGTDVTVSVATIYNMSGVKMDDLKLIVENDVNGKIDLSKQVILDNGLTGAVYKLLEKKANSDVSFSIALTATAGPQLDAATVAGMVKGKKKGEAISIIKSRPGVKEVSVDYSPFWVTKAPGKPGKTTVIFVKSTDAK